MVKSPSLGSVISGTMQPRDLIPAFLDALRYECGVPLSHPLFAERLELIDVHACDGLDAWYDTQDAADFLLSVMDALNDCAPAYCYFSSHPDDGARYGFWPDMDNLEEAATYPDVSDVVKVNAGDEWPKLASRVSYVMEVTDHGNVTLYCALTRRELWSLV